MYMIGTWTLTTRPGLKRHLRSASSVESSRMALPQLCAIRTLITVPEVSSTVTNATPDPVTRRRRASYGYTGRGAYATIAFTDRNDAVVPLTREAGRVVARCARTGGGATFSSWKLS